MAGIVKRITRIISLVLQCLIMLMILPLIVSLLAIRHLTGIDASVEIEQLVEDIAEFFNGGDGGES